MIQQILFIKNYIFTENLFYLDKFNINYIYSFDIINYNDSQLNELIDKYHIIIIGGGPQHLTFELINNYPEIKNLIKIINLAHLKSKLLIGLCLGCQIIAYTFGLEIIQMNNLCIGFGYLDINSLNNQIIEKDKYLNNLDYHIISKSFSYHNDCINFKSNNELELLAKSNNNIPYIVSPY